MQFLDKPSDLIDQLLAFDTFAGLERQALGWLVDHSEYFSLEAGEFLFKQSAPADYVLILMKGEFVVSFERGARRREIGAFHEGSVGGILPFSRMKEMGADGKALKPCLGLRLHKKHFTAMVNASYELTEALVATMSTRIRDYSQFQFQDEKLMALGRLSAGLAHELNNPASAMVRSSEELYKFVHSSPERHKAVITMKMTPDQADRINSILFPKLNNLNQHALTILEREERRDALLDWLEKHGVAHADDIAETYLEIGMEPAELESIADVVSEEGLPLLLWWIDGAVNMEKLVVEIRQSADRIAELVAAVKGYSYMDRGTSREPTDLHEGIDITLMVLKHKLKERQIQVVREFDSELPKEALPGI